MPPRHTSDHTKTWSETNEISIFFMARILSSDQTIYMYTQPPQLA
jgi:hypothetical protein